MEEEAGVKEPIISNEDNKGAKEEIYTKVVRAGKRTYFFDVKATRKEDYYLTITESKKRLGKEGKVFYEKHKIFLYKEDFDKFADGLRDAVSFIESGKGEIKSQVVHSEEDVKKEPEEVSTREFINVDFDDLGKK
jgi:hypothetical protein